MNKFYRIIISCMLIFLLTATSSRAQNNLAAGDLAIVSYQSDKDLSNADLGGSTKLTDRFSIVVLKGGGLAAGTVIYFTDNGWNTTTGDFISGLTEGFIKWTVPTGGIALGTEVYFISSYDNTSGVTSWNAYLNEAGTTSTGTVTTESGSNYMELSSAGDQILLYQTGAATGTAGAYNDATRRFITAIHANVEPNVTTYAAWDGAMPAGGHQSSIPTGLTNGTNAFLLSKTTLPVATVGTGEWDDAKYNGTSENCNVTTIITAINTSSNLTLSNTAFAIGSTSLHNTYKVDTVLATSSTSVTQAVNTNNNLYYNTPCALIAQVVPFGGTGNITGNVWIESSVPTYKGEPFVARHYQIAPGSGSSAFSPTITLYFTQAEFNAFNASPLSTLKLPTGPGDNAGMSNLRIGAYSGTSNDGSGLPASYTSGVTVIDPASWDIVWNATAARWEVSFLTGTYGGFIIQTATHALPVNLMSFAGQLNNNDVSLQWKTSGEINHDYFEVERSTDGQTFSAAGRVPGTNSGSVQNYSWFDAGAGLLTSSKLFYRLKMVSTTGEAEYSNILTFSVNKPASPIVSVTPNPFISNVNISLQMPEAARVAIRLTDITGQLLKSEYTNVPKGSAVLPITGIGNLTQGIYVLSLQFNGHTYTYKLIK